MYIRVYIFDPKPKVKKNNILTEYILYILYAERSLF